MDIPFLKLQLDPTRQPKQTETEQTEKELKVWKATNNKSFDCGTLTLGGRVPYPGMEYTYKTRLCNENWDELSLPVCTIHKLLPYGTEQLLFHASTNPTVEDNGQEDQFRFYSFEAKYSLNYVEEEKRKLLEKNPEAVQKNPEAVVKEYLHVFKINENIPNIIMLSDTKTWLERYAGFDDIQRCARFDEYKLRQPLGGVDEALTKELGMTKIELQIIRWLQRKNGTDAVKGWIKLNEISNIKEKLVDFGFEFVLFGRQSDYLQHLNTYTIVDDMPRVQTQRIGRELGQLKRAHSGKETQSAN